MKKYLLTSSLFLLIIISACSENKLPLASVSHPEGWNAKTSESFHGTKVLEAGHFSCNSCHGSDYKGRDNVTGCHDCHSSYPHAAEWMIIADNNSHKAFIENANESLDYCKKCHGDNLFGGSAGVSCYQCHPGGSFD